MGFDQEDILCIIGKKISIKKIWELALPEEKKASLEKQQEYTSFFKKNKIEAKYMILIDMLIESKRIGDICYDRYGDECPSECFVGKLLGDGDSVESISGTLFIIDARECGFLPFMDTSNES